MPTQVEGPNIIYGVEVAPTARARAGSPLELMFEKRPIVSLLFDQSEDYPRQFGGDRRVGLATQVSVERIAGNIMIKLSAEAILAHSHGALRRHPQSGTQPGIAILGDVALATGFA